MSDLITAAELAARLGVSRDWVYDHAADLGAIRMGNGPRPRLRFDLERVRDALAAKQYAQAIKQDNRRLAQSTPLPKRPRMPLLPIRGDG